MKCKICNGSGTLEIANDSEYDEGFCNCGNCGGTGVVKKKAPQNLPKADAYSLLAEVLDDWIKDLESEEIYILPKLLEKMKSFRVKHFS